MVAQGDIISSVNTIMFKKLFIGLFSILCLASVAPAVQAAPVSPQTFFAEETCPGRLLTLPAWYRGLSGDVSCKPVITKLTDLWVIGLNIVEDLLHVTAYVAACYFTWGGFRYMLANGEPDKIASAKGTINNAATGLVISVVAIAAVNFIVDAAF